MLRWCGDFVRFCSEFIGASFKRQLQEKQIKRKYAKRGRLIKPGRIAVVDRMIKFQLVKNCLVDDRSSILQGHFHRNQHQHQDNYERDNALCLFLYGCSPLSASSGCPPWGAGAPCLPQETQAPRGWFAAGDTTAGSGAHSRSEASSPSPLRLRGGMSPLTAPAGDVGDRGVPKSPTQTRGTSCVSHPSAAPVSTV